MIKSAALDNLAAATKTIIPKYIQEKREVDRSDILAYDFNDDANYDFEKLIRNLTGGVDNTDYRSWYTAFEAAVVYRKTTLKNYSGIILRFLPQHPLCRENISSPYTYVLLKRCKGKNRLQVWKNREAPHW